MSITKKPYFNFVKLSPAQLTQAQMGKPVLLNTGEEMTATRQYGQWRYVLTEGGVVSLIRYADDGLENAHWAINASEEDYREA